ncbi:MAG: response regulator [Cyclobacteriaceae bacterium]|nr:response regulator [Cyclobacteriaceae bacterium]
MHKILLVEDDLVIRVLTRKHLRIWGYEVVEFENGLLAKEYLSETTELPDLVLTDIMMPILNGKELASFIKKCQKTKHLPIIAVTALDIVQFSQESLALFDHVFTKPTSTQKLKRKIKEILNPEDTNREKNT